jgi:hypothetical protein
LQAVAERLSKNDYGQHLLGVLRDARLKD